MKLPRRLRIGILQTSIYCSLIITCLSYFAPVSFAQTKPLPRVNYLLDARQPPGAVAQSQIARQVPGVGTFQPVSISGPENLRIGLARDGQFLPSIEAPVVTGMLVGAVYRFRVTNIPFRPGEEVYPTLEVIDRVFAPAGREHRFPIPVVLTAEDIRLALEGAMVTRVIYLEDSEVAEPIAQTPDTQRTTTVGPTTNALQAADQLGRPVAILRIGSRVPADMNGDLTSFLYGCAPWIPLPTAPNREQLIESGQWPSAEPAPATDTTPRAEPPGQDFPRVPGL